jgi:hypothetical protein
MASQNDLTTETCLAQMLQQIERLTASQQRMEQQHDQLVRQNEALLHDKQATQRENDQLREKLGSVNSSGYINEEILANFSVGDYDYEVLAHKDRVDGYITRLKALLIAGLDKRTIAPEGLMPCACSEIHVTEMTDLIMRQRYSIGRDIISCSLLNFPNGVTLQGIGSIALAERAPPRSHPVKYTSESTIVCWLTTDDCDIFIESGWFECYYILLGLHHASSFTITKSIVFGILSDKERVARKPMGPYPDDSSTNMCPEEEFRSPMTSAYQSEFELRTEFDRVSEKANSLPVVVAQPLLSSDFAPIEKNTAYKASHHTPFANI